MLYVKRLQNSISYIGYTVLQETDRQHIAETHLFIVSTFSEFMLIINHLQLKVDAVFSTFSIFSLIIKPLLLKVAAMLISDEGLGHRIRGPVER